MARNVAIGIQSFDKIIDGNYFYIDKTSFIKEWWESGFGRYDVMIEPRDKEKEAIILEFKVFNPKKEATLEDTVYAALAQIEEKDYAVSLIAKGIPAEHIRKYGFAFDGKKVLICES